MMSSTGTIYLLHFDAAGPGGTRHYLGWTLDLQARLDRHGSGDGARLTRACVRRGITWRLTAVIDGSRLTERRLKRRHAHARLCLLCRAAALARKAEHERAARAAGRRPRKSRAVVA